MGYRVEYDQHMTTRSIKIRRRFLVIAVIFLLMALICNIFPELNFDVRRILFSGDPTVTVAALEDLSNELRAGKDLSDSLRSFCMRILEGAGF